MATKKSTRALGRKPVPAAARRSASRIDVSERIERLDAELQQIYCTLYCASEVLDASDALDSDKAASRARNVIGRCVDRLNALSDALQNLASECCHQEKALKGEPEVRS